MTNESSVGTERCDRCGSEGETTALYRDGRVWACLCIECHNQIAEFALTTPDEPGQTPQEEWEEHNVPFDYEPPQKPPELWSSDEYQELHDLIKG